MEAQSFSGTVTGKGLTRLRGRDFMSVKERPEQMWTLMNRIGKYVTEGRERD